MGEVGRTEPSFPREIGEYARDRGIARLYALGEQCARTAVASFGAGRQFDTANELSGQLALDAQAGVTLLVKGSRLRMERLVATLTGNKGGH